MNRIAAPALAALVTMAAIPSTAALPPSALTPRDIALAGRAFASPFAVPAQSIVIVDATAQRMVLWQDREARRIYRISTARAGTGNRDGSGRTPCGWHRVAERFGAGAPLGQVFVSRVATGEVLPEASWSTARDDDKVLTRIMWLEGLEPGVNSGPGIDSHERYIYIHGTNQEQLLGTPASHGCIRLSNRDVADLFALTEGDETLCLIAE